MKIRHITLRHTPEMLLQMVASKEVAIAVLEAFPKIALLVRVAGVPAGRRLAAHEVSIEVRGADSFHKARVDMELPAGTRRDEITLHVTAPLDLALIATVEVETAPPGRRGGGWAGAETETFDLPVRCAIEPEVGRVE